MEVSEGLCAALPPELIRDATQNFDGDLELGDGAYATVYKGDIEQCKKIPAATAEEIKRVGMPRYFAAKVTVLAEEDLEDDSDSFEKQLAEMKKELRILANCRHPNICTLFGFAYDKDFRCLVYEICDGGDLFTRLHEVDEEDVFPIPVSNRFNLASDIACGLEYLHTEMKPPIIHRY